MKHQLLSNLELSLSRRFESTFMPPAALLFYFNEDTNQEIEKYFSYLSTQTTQIINLIYNNVYELLCTPHSVIKSTVADESLRVSDHDCLMKLIGKSLPDISNMDTLREVFSAMFHIHRRVLKQNNDEKTMLEQLSPNVKLCWEHPDFITNARLYHFANGDISIIADFSWGQMEIKLLDVKCFPANNGEQVYCLEHKELYAINGGFGLTFRYFTYADKGAIEAVSDTDYDIFFSGAEYQCKLFNYYDYCMINRIPADRHNLLLASYLSLTLVEKHRILGNSILNESEQLLFPAAQIMNFLNINHSFWFVKTLIEDVTATPEQLDEWARRLQSEGKDKYLHKMFTAISKCKANMTNGNIRKMLNRIKNTSLELTTIEGRYVLHWVLSKFEEACSQYMPKPANRRFLDTAIFEFRGFVTERLQEDGFSGAYPHYRKMASANTGHFISFTEDSYSSPDRLIAMMTAGVIALDKDSSVQGIPFHEITAYDCQYGGIQFDGKYKSRYSIVCGFQNPAYRITCLDTEEENARSAETAKAVFEIHLEQAYRILSGQRMTKDYKAQYGIKNDFWARAWNLAIVCFLMGIGWSTGFWLLYGITLSASRHEPYLTTLRDFDYFLICFAGGLFFAFVFWLIFFFLMSKAHSRN